MVKWNNVAISKGKAIVQKTNSRSRKRHFNAIDEHMLEHDFAHPL